jgi:hypothetical protein
MASRAVHDFLDPADASLEEPGGMRSAGRRANRDEMPQFGAYELVQEIDCQDPFSSFSAPFRSPCNSLAGWMPSWGEHSRIFAVSCCVQF